MMKYVFYHIFYPASAPKSAQELIEYAKSAVGSEMLRSSFEMFERELQRRVREINEKGKIHLSISFNTCDSGGANRNGQISISTQRKWGITDIIRLSFIRVDALWAEHTGELKRFTFNQWDKMIYENAKKGGEV
jgi:hypothetical protein